MSFLGRSEILLKRRRKTRQGITGRRLAYHTIGEANEENENEEKQTQAN